MRDPRRDRRLLVAWLLVAFAASGVTDVRVLGGALAVAGVAFARGIGPVLRRTLAVAALPSAGLALASWGWLRLLGERPPPAPFVALALRATLIAFVGFAILARVELLRALEPFPLLSRLLAVTLGQVHAMRLLLVESRQGLASRLPRRPGPGDVLRNAGGVTAALFALAARNAREVGEAMRARGF